MAYVPYILGEVVADEHGNLFRRADGRKVQWEPRKFQQMESTGGGEPGPPGTTDWDGLTNVPAVIAAGEDAASARSAIGAAPRESVVYAAESGIATDGTDVTTALRSLLTTITDGSVLRLEGKEYHLPTLRNHEYDKTLIIRGERGKTRITGDGSVTTSYNDDAMLEMQPGSSIRFENIIFENAGFPIGFKDLFDLGDIEFVNCEFHGCGGVVVAMRDNDSSDQRTLDGNTMSFRNFRMSGCKVYNCRLGVYLPTAGGWESVMVSDNVFDNVGQAGVVIGYAYGLTGQEFRDRTVFQPLQSAVLIHDNVFKNMHYPEDYTFSNKGANAIAAWGQAVSIHGNYIENVNNSVVFDDCEGIYTKARYVDIHDNIMVNAGGTEAAIMVKGIAYDASTTLAASMDGLNLPQTTINVASTEGFGKPRAGSGLFIETSLGFKAVGYTGMTPTSFTGVTGGVAGMLATGGIVRGDVSYHGTDSGAMDGVSTPNKVHDNVIVFTRTDVEQRGVMAAVPGIEISRNLIVGSTGSAAILAYWGAVIQDNIIRDHHGAAAIASNSAMSGNGFIIRNNKIQNMDGAYVPGASSLQAINITANAGYTLGDIVIEGNVIRNELTAAGALSAASAKLRAIFLQASTGGMIADVTVRNNRARNINRGLHIVTTLGPVTGLNYSFNSWANEAGSAPTDSGLTWPTSLVIDENLRASLAGPFSPDRLTSAISTLPRWAANSTSVGLSGSGTLHLTYFSADKAMTVTQVRVVCGSTAAGATPTLVRIGLYKVSAIGDLTLIASTVNDTGLLASASAVNTKSFAASADVSFGDRLAVGVLVVSAAAMPTLAGTSPTVGSAELSADPRDSGKVASLTDLPTSVAAADVTTISGMLYARIY